MKRKINCLIYPLAVVLMSLFVIVGCSDDDDDTSPGYNFDYGSVADFDGNIYKTVVIGNREWMAENLAYAPLTGNYWAYDNDNANVEIYGYLYDWETALTVCPVGWHLPTDSEWTELTDYLGDDAGGKLKATGTIEAETGLWSAPNTAATNETGFAALPGGQHIDGNSTNIGNHGYWWTSTKTFPFGVWRRSMSKDDRDVHRYSSINEKFGYSVRCIRDREIEYGEITDSRDGTTYQTVVIGDQIWMAENLAYLPSITFEDDWGSDTEPQFAVYDYAPGSGYETVAGAKSTENYHVYGVLYNWVAAMNGAESSDANPSGVQGICPTGWHLPSDEEWTQLTDYLNEHPAGKLKDIGTIEEGTGLWHEPNLGATNETGFTAIPGGYKQHLTTGSAIGNMGRWWTATEKYFTVAWVRGMDHDRSYVNRNTNWIEFGFSVRCVKN